MATIYNTTSNTLVSGTSKADYIINEGEDVGEGDVIASENVTIRALAGNDTISNQSDNVTIIGGSGNDSISLDSGIKNNLIQYSYGEGNDTVIGFNSSHTLRIARGSYSTTKSGDNFIVKVGSGKIVLKDALADETNSINIENSSGELAIYNDWEVWQGSITGNIKGGVTLAGSKNDDTIGNQAEYVLITGKSGNDSISNSGDDVTINGGAGSDTIYTSSSYVTIDGGKGNDYISNVEYSGDSGHALSYASINGGAGSDTIYIDGGSDVSCEGVTVNNITVNGGAGNDYITLENFDSDHDISVNGGAGNDTISNVVDGATITGGSGKDLISLDGAENNVIQYASGDGNDTIFGFDSDDILHITKGNYTAEVSGDDVIFTVGKGKITLKDAKGKEITITETKTFGEESSELFIENNFSTADNLSEIVENNLTAIDYKVETKIFENLTENNLITLAEK